MLSARTRMEGWMGLDMSMSMGIGMGMGMGISGYGYAVNTMPWWRGQNRIEKNRRGGLDD